MGMLEFLFELFELLLQLKGENVRTDSLLSCLLDALSMSNSQSQNFLEAQMPFSTRVT